MRSVRAGNRSLSLMSVAMARPPSSGPASAGQQGAGMVAELCGRECRTAWGRRATECRGGGCFGSRVVWLFGRPAAPNVGRLTPRRRCTAGPADTQQHKPESTRIDKGTEPSGRQTGRQHTQQQPQPAQRVDVCRLMDVFPPPGKQFERSTDRQVCGRANFINPARKNQSPPGFLSAGLPSAGRTGRSARHRPAALLIIVFGSCGPAG